MTERGSFIPSREIVGKGAVITVFRAAKNQVVTHLSIARQTAQIFREELQVPQKPVEPEARVIDPATDIEQIIKLLS